VPGHIYIGPPDHHLLLERRRIQVTRGPKENGFRPAVDPLFRTAALAFGREVIGVILSGGQNDGTHGLCLIKRYGGIAIVQNPSDAAVGSMPESAIRHCDVDHVVSADQMGAIIAGLVDMPVATADGVIPEDEQPDVAEAGSDALHSPQPAGPPSVFTCPECSGTLWEIKEGDLMRYRCRVGHAFTAESLVGKQNDAVEQALWTAVRVLEESSASRMKMAARAHTGSKRSRPASTGKGPTSRTGRTSCGMR
jgi:two-component system chemotaxis response regulator CheB